jgi:putative transcriptional regulator
MRISYKKLWLLLLERDISKATLGTDLKLASGTMAKLNKGEDVALSVLMRICQYLHCDIGDICAVILEEKEEPLNF